ncbi:MAG TPA: chloride channel protein [Polyangia bacterium]|nr:chloride channel protein [Polyangia bacterium]
MTHARVRHALHHLRLPVHVGMAAAIVGLLAGGFAVAFRAAQALVFVHLYRAPNVLLAFERLPAGLRVAIPAAGGALAAGLSAWIGGGRSMAEIMEAVAVAGRRISVPAALGKAGASFAAISSGGSLGREGPLLHFGAAIASAVGRRAFLDPRRVRTLIAAGTAAGFAAAYNTPIAAVLFVVEIVAGTTALELALPALIAVTVATLLSRWALGPGPLYGLRNFSLAARSELLGYLALGVITGVGGAGFTALVSLGRRTFARLPAPPVARGALGGLLVGLCALRFAEVTGNGYEVIQLMLDARVGVAMMAVLLIVKAFGTAATVGSGSPGGVFTPSLFLGAAMGGIVGAGARAIWHAPGFPGGYALCGMAGAIAATTRAPIMASVLGFELSGDYAIVLPLFITTATATALARPLHKKSIYGQG